MRECCDSLDNPSRGQQVHMREQLVVVHRVALAAHRPVHST